MVSCSLWFRFLDYPVGIVSVKSSSFAIAKRDGSRCPRERSMFFMRFRHVESVFMCVFGHVESSDLINVC
jgi:hypothetical protein